MFHSRPVSSRGLPPRRDQLEGPHGQAQAGRRPAAPDQGPDTRHQFLEQERFGQVVIAADIQPDNPVVEGIPGRQDQHRREGAPLPELPDQVQTAHARQPDIDDRQIVGGVPQHRERRLGRTQGVDTETFAAQGLRQPGGQHVIIFDQQQSHRRAPYGPSPFQKRSMAR